MISIPIFFAFDLFKKGVPLAKKLMFIILFVFNLYFMACLIHFLLYFYFIPQTHLEIKLAAQNLQKFQANILNLASEGTYNLCNQRLNEIISFESHLNFTKKEFCELSLKTSLDEMFLEKESYGLKLVLKYHLFFTPSEIDQELKVGTYLINQNMEIYKLNQNFSLSSNDNNFRLLSSLINEIRVWSNYFVNTEYEQTKEFNLITKIPNQVFDVQAIFIDIPHINGVIYEANLMIDANLRGFRQMILLIL